MPRLLRRKGVGTGPSVNDCGRYRESLRVIAVEYDSFGETVLTGVLEAGQIAGGDAIRVPTANGASFQSVVASMEGPGPESPPPRGKGRQCASYRRRCRHSTKEGRRRSCVAEAFQ